MTYLSSQQVSQSDTNTIAHVSHFGALKTSPTYPVVKANFPGSALDTGTWTETTANGGSTTVEGGQATLRTNTSPNGSVKLVSVETGVFEAGQVTVYQSGVRAGVGAVNNVRRWGVMTQDEQDGLFFEWNGATFYVVSRKAGVDTQTDSANFNREPGWEPEDENNTFRIQYSEGRALFQRSRSGNIATLHVAVDSQTPLVNDLNLALYYENTNTNGNAVNVDLVVRGASSSIFGELPTSRAGGTIEDTTVTTLSKSVITGRAPSGGYRNVGTNGFGALITIDFLQEVVLENVPGYTTNIKFGRNVDMDVGSTPEDICFGTGLYAGQPTTAPETVDVLSSSAADTAAGTGMQSILITGLETATSTQETTETIALNGTGGATSVNTWYRVYRAAGVTYGSGGTNAGTITVRHTATTADEFVIIPPGVGQSLVGAITVPSGKTMFIESLAVTLERVNGSPGSGIFSLRSKPNTTDYLGNSIISYTISTAAPLVPPLVFPIRVPENTDIVGRIDSVSDNNSQASITMNLLFVDNPI